MIIPGCKPSFIYIADKKSNTLTDSQKERFDKSLEYLAETIRHDSYINRPYVSDTELFSHTYYPD